MDPESNVGGHGQRLSVWEVLGVVTTFRHNVERLKLYKATLSVVRFMAVLNFVMSVMGMSFLVIGLFPTVYMAMDVTHLQSMQFLRCGVFISLFAPLALSCDLMALRGLKTWKKGLLLPWLVLYAIFLALVMAVLMASIFHNGFHWRFLLLTLSCMCFISAWKQVRMQYATMILPRPTLCTVEDLATDLRARETVVTESPPNDLPPKYDELDQPPKYEERA